MRTLCTIFFLLGKGFLDSYFQMHNYESLADPLNIDEERIGNRGISSLMNLILLHDYFIY